MASTNKIILPITPMGQVRSTQGDSIVFRIPEVCPKDSDEYKDTGLCEHTLYQAGRYRKRRLEKYNKFKKEIRMLAGDFALPQFGFSLYFYFPMPIRWSKKKKERMHGQPHLIKPDLDNCEKAIFDSLSKFDQRIGQLSGHGKFWDKNIETGYT